MHLTNKQLEKIYDGILEEKYKEGQKQRIKEEKELTSKAYKTVL